MRVKTSATKNGGERNFTGMTGRYVKLEDTIRSFQGLVAGDYDHIPEQCFYMCGAIEEVIENFEKLQAEG